MRRLIQPHAGALIISSVVFCQERTNYGMFPATSHNGSQRLIQSWNARCLAWPFSVSYLNERRYNPLRFTATARGDCCAWFVGTVSDAGAELPGDNRSDDTGARLFQDCVGGLIDRARFSLVLAAAIASQERRQLCLDNTQSVTIPARAPGRAGGHCR